MRNRLRAVLLILVFFAAPCGLAFAEPHAQRIDAANAAQLRLGGTDAVGGIEDWALGDGTLCAVVSDPAHESDFSTSGGSLVDLGRCGRGDDQFALFDQLRNLSPSKPFPITSVSAEEGPLWARLVARGETDGLAIATTYTLDAARAGRLRVSTRLTRVAAGESLFGVGGAFVNAYVLRPFVTSIASPGRSRGFVGPAFLGLGAGAIAAAAVAADGIVLVGENSISPGVSYGARILGATRESDDGERSALPVFIVADDLATIVAIFARPFWIGGESSLGWFQLLQTKWMDLGVGESLSYEMEVIVGERADVASALDSLLDDAAPVTGRVDDPTARIRIDAPDGAPVTEMRPAADGTFRARVRPGAYSVTVDAPGGRKLVRPLRVEAAGADLGLLAVAAPARVELPRGSAMRLVFVGEAGTPDPSFGDDLLGFAVLGKEIERNASTRDLSLSGTASDPRSVAVAPGSYRVYATHGLEFSVTEAALTARPGETVVLAIDPPARAFETPGWIAADFHVHGARSLDSALADTERLSAYVAEGGEVLVATDHEAVTDYGPQIEAMGLGAQLATVVGLEVTSEARTPAIPHTIGHANAFPYRADPLAYRDGVPPNEGRRWRDVLPALRAQPGERVLQLNHARYPGAPYHPRGFFTHLGFVGEPYDPNKRLDEWPNQVLIDPDPKSGARDLDFDALELLNGKRVEAYADLAADWFSLLRQGVVMTGTANSDSHNLAQIVALPRNYVAVGDDRIAGFDEAALVRAVREQRSFGTTGPFVAVDLDGVGMGERFQGRDGTLNVRVQVAPWIALDALRVLVDGREVDRRPIGGAGAWQFPLHFDTDTFVTIEVRGAGGPTYAAVLPGFTPIAFTNPIFVDADGDGAWRPSALRP